MIKKLNYLFSLCLALTLLVVSTSSSYAQDEGLAGLTITPPKFELVANPGEVLQEIIRVRNNSDMPLSFGVLVEDFSSAGEAGNVVLEEGENDLPYSLKRWIEPSAENIVMQPNEEISFPFQINVPRDADPGGHYASVLFQIGSDETSPGSATVQHRLGSLVLLRVTGDVVEEAAVETFEAPFYSQSGPIEFALRVRNDGTTHIVPNGTIIVTNMFGQKVDELPLNSANVFPGAIRRMDTQWDPGNVLGHYTATLVATYGNQSLPLTAATTFNVASPVVIIMSVVGIISGIIFLISIIAGRKRLMTALKVLSTGSK